MHQPLAVAFFVVQIQVRADFLTVVVAPQVIRWKWGGRAVSPVECQRVGTASLDIERTDQGILEFARGAFEGESRLEDLLFVLNFEGVCGEKIFNVSGDLERARFKRLRRTQTISRTVARFINPGAVRLNCRSMI